MRKRNSKGMEFWTLISVVFIPVVILVVLIVIVNLDITERSDRIFDESGMSQVLGICSDSDGGQDYFREGTVTKKDSDDEETDTCSGGIVHEWYCDGDDFQSYSYTCPNGCNSEGNACEGGEYVVGSGTNMCTDSDGGENYFKESRRWKPGILGSDRDGCSGSDGGQIVYSPGPYVVEGYCKSDASRGTTYYECPFGCDCSSDGSIAGNKHCACKRTPFG